MWPSRHSHQNLVRDRDIRSTLRAAGFATCPKQAFARNLVFDPQRGQGQFKPNGPLVLVSFASCDASTPSLSTSWSTTDLQGILVLWLASRLDAFSGYPFPT